MTGRPLKSTRLSVSLEDSDHKSLSEIAARNDASLSWVIRKAIRAYVESYKQSEFQETKK
ncbi:ribbon-helix-helix domain-containing protein [Ruegeria sp. HKCCA4008]|uniref:ribbon-helix-helix domain-containing protein n=1 Tax=Ruegeria sp. HKCCA4008 TaxID=2682999 RepID=UPI001488C256